MTRLYVDMRLETTAGLKNYVEIGVESGSLFLKRSCDCGKPRRNAFKPVNPVRIPAIPGEFGSC
jgi:hypothetical protein